MKHPNDSPAAKPDQGLSRSLDGWKIADIPDAQLSAALSNMLRPPIGWAYAGEPDALVGFLEKLLPEIRSEATRAKPTRQKLIDKLVLQHLDIGLAAFGEKNLRALALARAELLQDILQRAEPALPLDHHPSRKRGGKIKLGIVVRYFKPFIDNWVLAGFLTALPRDKYEITLYSVQDIEQRIDPNAPEQKAFHKNFMTLIDRYEPLDTLPLKATVEKIRADQNDIMLLGNAMHSGTAKAHLLQAYRLAPIEIVTTNTPFSCGFPAIDYYMTAKPTEPSDAAAHYTEKIAWLPHQSFAMEFDPAPDAARAFASKPEDAAWFRQQGIPDEAPVMVSGSGWPKLTPETLAAWADIMQAVPEAHLILDPHSPSWRGGAFAEAQKQSVAKLMPPGRCHILDLYPAKKTLAVMARASLYLDAFPYSGNMALREPLLMGSPVITRITPHQRGMQGAALLKSIGMDELVAADSDGYKKLATNLLRDKAAQAKMRARIKSAMEQAPLYDPQSLSRDFSRLLEKLVAHAKSP